MINIVFIGFNYKYAIIGFEWFWIIPQLSLPTLHNAGCLSVWTLIREATKYSTQNSLSSANDPE